MSDGSADQQERRQTLQEQPATSRREPVGARGPEGDVEDADGRHHRQRHQHHGEEQVLSEQGDGERSRRDDLSEQEDEYSKRHQHGDAERDLLAGLSRKIEDKDCQPADATTGDDEVNGVEDGLAAHGDVEGDIDVATLLAAAVVEDLVSPRRYVHQVPLHIQMVVLQVDTVLNSLL